MVERFDAMIIRGDPPALKVKELLCRLGYSVSHSAGQWKVSCVEAMVTEAMRADSVLWQALSAATSICPDGEPFKLRLIKGLCYLARHMARNEQDLFVRGNIAKLVRMGQTQLLQKMDQTIAAYGKSGERVFAQGLLLALNRSRSHGRIPSII